MPSIDRLLGRRYRRETYNCTHLTAEAWLHLTGDDISEQLSDVLNGVRRRHFAGFRRVDHPVTPCIALMRRHHTGQLHVGVYIDRRILHIEEHGVSFHPVDVATHGFREIRYYVSDAALDGE